MAAAVNELRMLAKDSGSLFFRQRGYVNVLMKSNGKPLKPGLDFLIGKKINKKQVRTDV